MTSNEENVNDRCSVCTKMSAEITPSCVSARSGRSLWHRVHREAKKNKLAKVMCALATAKEQQRSCESRLIALNEEEADLEEELARAIEACSFAIPDSPPIVTSVPATSLAAPPGSRISFSPPAEERETLLHCSTSRASEDRATMASSALFATVSALQDRRAVFQRRARINRLQILDEVQKAHADARRAVAAVPEADASASSALCADFDWRLAGRLQEEVVRAGDVCPVEPVLRPPRSASPRSRAALRPRQQLLR